MNRLMESAAMPLSASNAADSIKDSMQIVFDMVDHLEALRLPVATWQNSRDFPEM